MAAMLQRVLKYLQSTSEAFMNVICGAIALISMKILSLFEFYCPCLPGLNRIYGLAVMFMPPLALFFIGVFANKYTIMILEDMFRPNGGREKNKAVTRYMCTSVIQRAMIAPVVWIVVTLLDGKCFICAFSESIDADQFSGFANKSSLDVLLLLSKVPCKEDELIRNNPSRKAVARYLRCWSQALGWGILLFLIVLAFVARSIKPCFNQTAFLQTRYWSNYIDMEQKIFDETCCAHAREFAHKCILYFFESMQKEMKLRQFTVKVAEEEEEEEDHLHGVTDLHQMNSLLKNWYEDKPPLDISPALKRQHCGVKELLSPAGYYKCNDWHFPQETRNSKQTDV